MVKAADAPAPAPPSLPWRSSRRGLPAWLSPVTLSWLLLGAAAVAAVVLHVVAADRFPTPWVDEAHFVMPGARLAATGTLDVPELNAPHGIYWMPDGYYALLAVVYTVLPATIAVARHVSLFLVLGTAGCLAFAARRLGIARLPAAVVVAAWLLAPHVVLAGNMARMEAATIFVAALAVALVAAEQWTLALAVAVLAPTIHPTGLLVAGFVALVSVWRAWPRRWWQWLGIGLALAAATAEGVHLLTHWPLVVNDITFQLVRKRTNNVALIEYTRATLLVPAAAGLLLVVWRRRRLGRLAPALVVLVGSALGFELVQALGQEMWYGVYARPTALAFLALAALAAVPVLRPEGDAPLWDMGTPRPDALLRRQGPAVLIALVCASATVGWWQAPTTQGLRMDDAARGEWNDFVTGVVDLFGELDARVDRPVLIGIEELGALTPELVGHPWRHLEFEQATPVTPIPDNIDARGRRIDYWLMTHGRLNAGGSRHMRPGPAWAWAPAITYSSRYGGFELRAYLVPPELPPRAAEGER